LEETRAIPADLDDAATDPPAGWRDENWTLPIPRVWLRLRATREMFGFCSWLFRTVTIVRESNEYAP
jgi:hypothetical protein